MSSPATVAAIRAAAKRRGGMAFPQAGVVFDFDPNNLAALSLVSGEIASATYKGRTISAASATRRPIHETVTLLDGRKGARFDPAGFGDEIGAASGLTGGNAPFSMLSVHKVNTGGAVALTRVGADQGGPAGSNAVVGGYYSSEFWNGGAGVVLPHGPAHDTSVHAWVKTFDGTTVRVFHDGHLAVGTDGTVNEFAQDYSLRDGSYAIGTWTTGYNADGTLYRAVWADACWNRSAVNAAMAKVGRLFPSLVLAPSVVIDGTSIEYGYGVTPGTNDWGKVAVDGLTGAGAGARYRNYGVSGQTIVYNANCSYGFMLSDVQSQVAEQFSGLRRQNIALVGAPTNDVYFGTSVEATLAGLATYVSTLEAAGFTVFVSTIISRFPDTSFVSPGSTLLQRWLDVNTGIRATYPAARILDFRADVPEVQDYTSATYFIEGPTGIHPTVAGHAAMGAYAAGKVNAYFGW